MSYAPSSNGGRCFRIPRMTDSQKDSALVALQIGREPRAFRRVAVRCPFGRPAVTEQSPYDPTGEPFPTTYYVTCRHLVQQISRLEAGGGVERWARAAGGGAGGGGRRAPAGGAEGAEENADLEARRHRAADEQRALRRDLAGGETGRDDGASLDLGVGGA